MTRSRCFVRAFNAFCLVVSVSLWVTSCRSSTTYENAETGLDATGDAAAADDAAVIATDLPEDKLLSELNPDEAVEFCELAQTIRNATIAAVSDPRVTCVYTALTVPGVAIGTGIDVAACKQALADCLANAPPPSQVPQLWSCEASQLSSAWTSCDITVGVAVTCANQLLAGITTEIENYNQVSCTQPDPGSAGNPFPATTASSMTAECTALFSQCPELLQLPVPG